MSMYSTYVCEREREIMCVFERNEMTVCVRERELSVCV